MYTQCPHCQTLFRISAEQLTVAAGMARCCQCKSVFNAEDNLRELPSTSEEPTSTETKETTLAESSHTPPPSETEIEEQNDGLEVEPDYYASGGESQMIDLLEGELPSEHFLIPEKKVAPLVDHVEHKNNFVLEDIADEPLDELESVLISEPDELSITNDPAEITATGQQTATPYPGEQFIEPRKPFSGMLWGVGAIGLLLILGLQLIWQFRSEAIHYESGRQLLSVMCQALNCTPPQRRDLSRIEIEHRDLRLHPEHPQALSLQLNMINNASFKQPFPQLQLSLFNDAGKLLATRLFEPSEYLPGGISAKSPMPRFRLIEVMMELVDPGEDVTGFKFDFL
ncbi:MAG: DUF3426 domain-containing protein [gamma proteobacterium endosymbiont of Lamellibrachia anaximandri]|nr:DUF3426 domain-containing protein [gamma proteobacterium endosymbiont of Lamellibrachia anaximandri]MBL3618884.1 DUF3426 domain-containing protein [gamma proteobacterium endosymbiont of Lamellibrachia anaximandri]